MGSKGEHENWIKMEKSRGFLTDFAGETSTTTADDEALVPSSLSSLSLLLLSSIRETGEGRPGCWAWDQNTKGHLQKRHKEDKQARTLSRARKRSGVTVAYLLYIEFSVSLNLPIVVSCCSKLQTTHINSQTE